MPQRSERAGCFPNRKTENTTTQRKEEGRMRVLECICGEHLRAENDDELSERALEHVDHSHAELRLGGERLRGIVAKVSYEER